MSDSFVRFSATCGPMTSEEKEYLIQKGLLFENSSGELYGEPSTLSFHLDDEALAKDQKETKCLSITELVEGRLFKTRLVEPPPEDTGTSTSSMFVNLPSSATPSLNFSRQSEPEHLEATFGTEPYKSFNKDFSDYIGKTCSGAIESVPASPYTKTSRHSSAQTSGASLFVFCPSECGDLGDDTCRTEKSYQESNADSDYAGTNKSGIDDLDFIPNTQYTPPRRSLPRTPGSRPFFNITPSEILTSVTLERETSLHPISEEEADDVEKANNDDVEITDTESDDVEEEDEDNAHFVAATPFSTTSGSSHVFYPSGNQEIANLTFDTEDSFQDIYEELSDYIDQTDSDNENEFVPATQTSTTSDRRTTSRNSSEWDDTITQMEKLLALADEVETEENLHLANINVIPFPPNLPSSHVEDELAVEGLVGLEPSFDAMDISENTSGMKNGTNQTCDFVEKDTIISPRRSKRMSIETAITKIRNRVKLLSATSTPNRSDQFNLTSSSQLKSQLAFAEETVDVNLEYFPPDLPCSYAETALAMQGELIHLQYLEENKGLDKPMEKKCRSADSRVLGEEMILSPPWAKENVINFKIQRDESMKDSSPLTPTKGSVESKSQILPKKRIVFKGPTTPTKPSSTPVKTPSTFTKTPAKSLREFQGKLKSPMQLKKCLSRQVSSSPSTLARFSSTPFRKGIPLIMSSPASTIGFPSPSPSLSKGKPSTNSMLKQIPFKNVIPKLTPNYVKTTKLPINQLLVKSPPPPVVKSSVFNINSPVASYVHSTPSVRRIKRAGGGTPERNYQTILPKKIVRLAGSGIPIRSTSFNSTLNGQSQELPKQVSAGELVEIHKQSRSLPPTPLTICTSTDKSESKGRVHKVCQSSSPLPPLVLGPVTMNANVETVSSAQINLEFTHSPASKGTKVSITQIELARKLKFPRRRKEGDESTVFKMSKPYDDMEEEEREFQEVTYVGSDANRQDFRIVTLVEDLIPPRVFIADVSPMVAFPAEREKENVFSQRHVGKRSSGGATSLVKKEHVIKTFIPSRVGMLK